MLRFHIHSDETNMGLYLKTSIKNIELLLSIEVGKNMNIKKLMFTLY